MGRDGQGERDGEEERETEKDSDGEGVLERRAGWSSRDGRRIPLLGDTWGLRDTGDPFGASSFDERKLEPVATGLGGGCADADGEESGLFGE